MMSYFNRDIVWGQFSISNTTVGGLERSPGIPYKSIKDPVKDWIGSNDLSLYDRFFAHVSFRVCILISRYLVSIWASNSRSVGIHSRVLFDSTWAHLTCTLASKALNRVGHKKSNERSSFCPQSLRLLNPGYCTLFFWKEPSGKQYLIVLSRTKEGVFRNTTIREALSR